MKNECRVFVPVMLCLFTCTGFAAECEDRLKPHYHRMERRFAQLMDRLAAEGLEYRMKIEPLDHETFWFGHRLWRSYRHTLTVPRWLRRELRTYDFRFSRGIFPQYVRDPKYSFMASVICLAHGRPVAELDSPLTPLAEHDRKAWDANMEGFITNIIRAGSSYKAVYWDPLFFESVPAKYLDAVFPAWIHSDGAPVLAEGPRPDQVRRLVGEFRETGAVTPPDGSHLEPTRLMCWSYWTLIDGDGPDPRETLDAFLACCRPAGRDHPHLAALMMAAFVVDGYEFDDETGEYRPNEMGRRLLDYVVEFPIPENASRLKIVMDGGNREWIEERMRQHGTEEAWREWLADPPKPEFKPFRQLPLEQWKKVYGARADEEFSRARQRDE